MEEDYLLAKNAALKICDCNSVYFEFFTVAIYAVLRKFSDYKTLALRIIDDCDIYIDDLPIDEAIRTYKILDGFIFDKIDVSATHAISIPGVTLSLEENIFGVEYSNPIIVCSKNDIDITSLLNCFVHEILHLVKSYFSCSEANHEDGLAVAAMRCGISISRHVHEDGEEGVISHDYFKILDEAINVIQTTEAMQEILALKDICPDYDVREFIDSLDEYKMQMDYGYFSVTPIIKTLWKNKQFRQLVERNIVSGEIHEIVNEFNEDMGDNMFQEMAQLVDDIYYADQDNKRKKVQRLKAELRSIIREYNSKNKVLQNSI